MQSDLSQSEADSLLHMEKFRIDSKEYLFPDFGGSIEVPLQSANQREAFLLDISRKRIALTTKYQTRGRQSLVLARLDFGHPHRNPDNAEVGTPHLHLYREGFGDKWAYAVPASLLKTRLTHGKYCLISWPIAALSNLQLLQEGCSHENE